MQEIFQPIVLGILQGVGEFLPISSTAHLALVPYFFHWEDPGLSFDVALHLGTLFAVLVYFWKDWIEIFKLVFKNKSTTHPLRLSEASNPQPTTYKRNILWLLI